MSTRTFSRTLTHRHTHTRSLYAPVPVTCSLLSRANITLDGYCSTVQGLLDWFEVDLGFTELLFIQIHVCVMCGVIDVCVMCGFVLLSRAQTKLTAAQVERVV